MLELFFFPKPRCDVATESGGEYWDRSLWGTRASPAVTMALPPAAHMAGYRKHFFSLSVFEIGT